MGRSFIVFVSFLCSASPLVQAGHQETIEPYQVIDIRMEDGLKSAAVTQHVAAAANGLLFSDAFLDQRDGTGFNKAASALLEQKAESAALSNLLAQFHGA